MAIYDFMPALVLLATQTYLVLTSKGLYKPLLSLCSLMLNLYVHVITGIISSATFK